MQIMKKLLLWIRGEGPSCLLGQQIWRQTRQRLFAIIDSWPEKYAGQRSWDHFLPGLGLLLPQPALWACIQSFLVSVPPFLCAARSWADLIIRLHKMSTEWLRRMELKYRMIYLVYERFHRASLLFDCCYLTVKDFDYEQMPCTHV